MRARVRPDPRSSQRTTFAAIVLCVYFGKTFRFQAHIIINKAEEHSKINGNQSKCLPGSIILHTRPPPIVTICMLIHPHTCMASEKGISSLYNGATNFQHWHLSQVNGVRHAAHITMGTQPILCAPSMAWPKGNRSSSSIVSHCFYLHSMDPMKWANRAIEIVCLAIGRGPPALQQSHFLPIKFPLEYH